MSFAGCFIKFTKSDYILDMQTKGLVYCNSVKWFTGIEDNFLRGDKLEDVSQFHFLDKPIVQLKPVHAPDSEYKTLPNTSDVIMTGRPLESMGNIYSLTALDLSNAPLNE